MASSVVTMIQEDEELGGDAWVMTRLAKQLGARIPLMCEEQVLYDGREDVHVSAIPQGVSKTSYAIYKRYTSLARVNLARPIVDAVTDRQRPNGMRLTSGNTEGENAVDDAYEACRMMLKINRAKRDVALHSRAYFLVADGMGTDRVAYVSPFNCLVSENEDSGIIYSYDEANSVERVTLLRLIRNEKGEVSDIYTRVAKRENSSRSLVDESDDDTVKVIADSWDTDQPKTWVPGTNWEWEAAADHDYGYAVKVGSLPLISVQSPDGKSQLSPHIGALLRINQGVFDRMCIITMQAFRQRAIKGIKNTVYKDNDPQVINGQAKAGDQIDFSSLFAMGPAALWMLPDGAEVWESQQTDFSSLLNAESRDIKDLAAASNTPLDILSPDVAGSAEGASLKREGITFKVEQLNQMASESIVRTMKMVLVLNGSSDAVDSRYEMQWLDPVPRDWLKISQAAMNFKDVLPPKTIWKKVVGLSSSEMQEAEQDLADTSFLQALSDQSAALSETMQAQSPGSLQSEDDFSFEDTADEDLGKDEEL
jgi:hypothetical protein